MRTLWDVPIPMDDGVVLRADVFCPDTGAAPTLMSYGPYAKGLPFQAGYPSAWEKLAAEHPDVTAGSSNRYQNWEVCDPEKWVPHGYAVVRVDSRGCGRSPGYIDHFSKRETADFHAAIEWAAQQPWSDGNIGLSGVSYYAMNQWQVAATRPPHLRAICIWEGASDFYRDATHHGGMLSTFWQHWYDKQIKTVQHGLGMKGPLSPLNGLPVCGDETLSEAELERNRCDFGRVIRSHPWIDEFHQERTADFAEISVPLLSSGNWGGQGLHLRGNIEGFIGAGSSQKWLELHGDEHWTSYYTDYGREIQLGFFDHFLKGSDNGWQHRPRVQLQVRHADGTFTERFENAWPIERTDWRELSVDLASKRLVPGVVGESELGFDAMGEGVVLETAPLDAETEITGPLAATLRVSTSAKDCDLFLTVHVIDPDGARLSFLGAIDPHTPMTQGWLRLSHRAMDERLSEPHRPVHSHVGPDPVVPGERYDVEIELWPTSVVVPAGHRLALTVAGRDFVDEDLPSIRLGQFKNDLRGCGPFLHDDPDDRPSSVFAGTTTLYAGGDAQARILLPVVPSNRTDAANTPDKE